MPPRGGPSSTQASGPLQEALSRKRAASRCRRGIPLYQCQYKIDKLHLNQRTDAVGPVVEVLMVNDHPAMLYSKYGLSDGWARSSAPLPILHHGDAITLGTNLVVFAMQ